jgi:hypothetical protein
MSKERLDYEIVDIIDKVMETVINTRNTTLEVKAHAIKMILYRDYNIDIAYDALKRRLKYKGVQ